MIELTRSGRLDSGIRRNDGAAFRLITIFLLLATLFTSLTACGWRLRGSMGVALALPPIYLDIQSGSAELRSELPSALTGAGVQLVQSRDAAKLVLVIYNETQQRRVLAVGSAGKVSEYELLYLLKFSVRDQAGKEVIETDTIRQQRDYSFNENEVLAKGEEQQQLFNFMRTMAIQTLLRRLTGLNEWKESPPEAPAATEAQPSAN